MGTWTVLSFRALLFFDFLVEPDGEDLTFDVHDSGKSFVDDCGDMVAAPMAPVAGSMNREWHKLV